MKWVSRSQWNAKYGRGPTNITPERGGIAIHWEGPKMGAFSHGECAGKVRGIERFHVERKGWEAIAYTLIVCPHGRVFEGRGVGHRTAANGTNDSNQRYYAVCALIGQGDAVPDELLDGIAEACDYLRRHDAGDDVQPHSRFFATACPGLTLKTEIQRGAFERGGSPSKPAPKPKPKPGKAPAFPGKLLTQPPIMRHSSVKTWQDRMRDRGWRISVDGAYGPQSEAVCRAFQREKGLVVDGIVGPKTWAAAWTARIT